MVFVCRRRIYLAFFTLFGENYLAFFTVLSVFYLAFFLFLWYTISEQGG